VQIELNRIFGVASQFSSEATEPTDDALIFCQTDCSQNSDRSFDCQNVEHGQEGSSQAFALHDVNNRKRELCDRRLLWHPNESSHPKSRNGSRVGSHCDPRDVIDLIHFSELPQLGIRQPRRIRKEPAIARLNRQRIESLSEVVAIAADNRPQHHTGAVREMQRD
jgi:hypothetical protein